MEIRKSSAEKNMTEFLERGQTIEKIGHNNPPKDRVKLENNISKQMDLQN